jgi:putative endonuclease
MRPRSAKAKLRDQSFGLRAETIAAWLLRCKGFRILAWRWKGGGGEIDLIARRGALIIFVEVKARPSLDQAMLALDQAKLRRMSAAARAWLGRHGPTRPASYRADAVLVAPYRWPRHIAGIGVLELFA